jgi:hypothetical protein
MNQQPDDVVLGRVHGVTIRQHFRELHPRASLGRVVLSAIQSVPAKHVVGLKLVLLRDVASLTRAEKNWKTRREAKLEECKGLYIRGRGKRPPKIDLFIDNIIHEWPLLFNCLPVFRALLVGNTLFHEIGHHIHYHTQPSKRDPESVAEYWQGRLLASFIRKNYRYSLPLLRLVQLTLPVVRLIARE